jgi:hypothetical protein
LSDEVNVSTAGTDFQGAAEKPGKSGKIGKRYLAGAKEHTSGAKEAAEKGRNSGREPQEHPSGAEAHVDVIALTARDPEGTPVVPFQSNGFFRSL